MKNTVRSSILIVPLLMLLGGAIVRADVVERRGAEPRLEGTVAKIDDGGVTLRSPSGAEYVVPWDRVRSIETSFTDPNLESFLQRGAQIWRARTRLERNDAALAEPLFERLFEHYRGKKHETALVVAEGLLRCRLTRNAHDEAVIPALEVMRLRRGGIATPSYSEMKPVLDERTGLCTALPPAWVASLMLTRLEGELADYNAQGEPAVSAIAALYRRAIQKTIGTAVDEAPMQTGANDPGVSLLAVMVDVQSSDPERREAGRNRLLTEMSSLPAWAQAWARYAVGMSLLNEPGTGRQEQGMVHLVHVAASFGADQPYLAGLALARLAEACDTTGELAAARSLRTELATRYPSHPILARIPSADSAQTRPATQPVQSTSKETT